DGGRGRRHHVMPPVFPDGLSDFVREVVRLPQARGLFRTAYAAGRTPRPGVAPGLLRIGDTVPVAARAPGTRSASGRSPAHECR
ncbi:hypothetical protein CTI14_27260, partial [Methylobacterium radiotolerans]